jgi:tetratricopeptide (TPR) repeat protein
LIQERILGEEHPDTATSLNNLATLYQDQGKYAEAEPLLVRALAICERVLGKAHPLTQTICENYVLLLQEMQGDTS